MSTRPKPGFTENIKNVIINNYKNFDGRARCSEFWFFSLFLVIVDSILIAIYFTLLMILKTSKLNKLSYIPLGILGLFQISIICPAIALGIRRLHDIGRSGYWVLLSPVPFANFYLIYLYTQDSQKEDNKYGSSPKYSIVSDDGLTE